MSARLTEPPCARSCLQPLGVGTPRSPICSLEAASDDYVAQQTTSYNANDLDLHLYLNFSNDWDEIPFPGSFVKHDFLETTNASYITHDSHDHLASRRLAITSSYLPGSTELSVPRTFSASWQSAGTYGPQASSDPRLLDSDIFRACIASLRLTGEDGGDPISLEMPAAPIICDDAGEEGAVLLPEISAIRATAPTNSGHNELQSTHGQRSDAPAPIKAKVASDRVRKAASKRRRRGDAKWMCNMCGDTFTRRFNLTYHLDAHADRRPFACTDCGKSFVRLHDLHRHEKSCFTKV